MLIGANARENGKKKPTKNLFFQKSRHFFCLISKDCELLVLYPQWSDGVTEKCFLLPSPGNQGEPSVFFPIFFVSNYYLIHSFIHSIERVESVLSLRNSQEVKVRRFRSNSQTCKKTGNAINFKKRCDGFLSKILKIILFFFGINV